MTDLYIVIGGNRAGKTTKLNEWAAERKNALVTSDLTEARACILSGRPVGYEMVPWLGFERDLITLLDENNGGTVKWLRGVAFKHD